MANDAVRDSAAAVPQVDQSLTSLYASIDYAEATKLLRDPVKFSQLYKGNQQFIDSDGDGNIAKPELTKAIADPTSTGDTKQLTKAMLAGYDQLQNYSSVGRTLADFVPDSQLFRNFSGHTGISKHDAEEYSRSLTPSEQGSHNNINGLKAAGLVAGAIAATYVFRRLPVGFLRHIGAGEATFGELLKHQVKAIPANLMLLSFPGALTYGGHRLVSYAGNREQSDINKNMFDELAKQKALFGNKAS